MIICLQNIEYGINKTVELVTEFGDLTRNLPCKHIALQHWKKIVECMGQASISSILPTSGGRLCVYILRQYDITSRKVFAQQLQWNMKVFKE